jgi:diguanylate cyclase (GGDEF)-like protein
LAVLIIALYALSILASFVILFLSIFKRSHPHTLYFTYMTFFFLVSAIGYLMEYTSTSATMAYAAVVVQYLGVAFIAPMLLLHVMDFCGIKPRAWHIIAVTAIPFATCVLVVTWPLNGIYYESFEFVTSWIVPYAKVAGSPFYYVYFGYSYLLILIASIVITVHYIHGDSVFRRHARILIAASLVLFGGNLLNVLFHPFVIDPTSILLAITCVMLGVSLTQSELFTITPLARERIVETMADGFILIDSEDRFLDANEVAKTIFPQLRSAATGAPVSEVAGLPKELCNHGGDVGGAGGREQPHSSTVFEFDDADKDKSYRVSSSTIMQGTHPICECAMVYDITETRQLMDQLADMAQHDPLTSLYNRRMFFSMADNRFAELKRHGGKAAVIMLDIDLFKAVNDTYGHAAGDEVLVRISQGIAHRLRQTDIVARYGGEEFCIYLSSTASQEAAQVAEELRCLVQDLQIHYNDQPINVTISLGVASYDSSRHQELSQLLTQADDALYQAKNTGRNKVTLA